VRMSRLIAEAGEKASHRFTRLHLSRWQPRRQHKARERILNTPLPLAYAVHLGRR
jgi:predicted membrane chloride channel (bestrophin family)